MNNDVTREEELQAPARLIEALGQAYSERIFVPPVMDQTILKAAELHLSPPKRPISRRAWWWTALATATAVLLAFALVTVQWKRSSQARFMLEDINHDGQIDILDAFALARQVKQRNPADKRLDLNGDGVIDDKDAAVIATHAVKLERGGRS